MDEEQAKERVENSPLNHFIKDPAKDKDPAFIKDPEQVVT